MSTTTNAASTTAASALTDLARGVGPRPDGRPATVDRRFADLVDQELSRPQTAPAAPLEGRPRTAPPTTVEVPLSSALHAGDRRRPAARPIGPCHLTDTDDSEALSPSSASDTPHATSGHEAVAVQAGSVVTVVTVDGLTLSAVVTMAAGPLASSPAPTPAPGPSSPSALADQAGVSALGPTSGAGVGPSPATGAQVPAGHPGPSAGTALAGTPTPTAGPPSHASSRSQGPAVADSTGAAVPVVAPSHDTAASGAVETPTTPTGVLATSTSTTPVLTTSASVVAHTEHAPAADRRGVGTTGAPAAATGTAAVATGVDATGSGTPAAPYSANVTSRFDSTVRPAGGVTATPSVTPTVTPSATPSVPPTVAPVAPPTLTVQDASTTTGGTPAPVDPAASPSTPSSAPATATATATPKATATPTGLALGSVRTSDGKTTAPGHPTGALSTRRALGGPPDDRLDTGLTASFATATAPTLAASSQPGVGAATGVTPVIAGTGATTPSGPLASATSPAAAAVVAQVFPETARLVGSGDGVHRLVLQLNPRALGEVRVVLTVRGGDVQVRFAAGDAARVALVQTSADLHRLLEQAGVQSARVDVRDLFGASSTTSSSGSSHSSASSDSASSWTGPSSTSADTAGGSPQGQPRTQDHHHPRTGGGHIATDGTDRTVRRVPGLAAGLPLDHTLISGVDLTM